MTAHERAESAATIIATLVAVGSLFGGAVLISMAYQSWEVGIGVALLVLFHKMR